MFFDWRQFHLSNFATPPVVDPRRRLRICLAGFAAALLVIFGRAAQLEVTQGAGFRAEALRPIAKETVLPAARGRILARDGTVLACDETIRAVAVEYRWLQDPPDERWLRNMVRMRLPKADRKNAEKIAAEKAKVLAERAELTQRLAKLCGLSPKQWAARTRKIQTRVERISESPTAAESRPLRSRRGRRLVGCPHPPAAVGGSAAAADRRGRGVAPHVVVEDVPPAVVSEIESNADRYPGVKIVELTRRTYPQGTLAAHVLGHLGPREERDATASCGRQLHCRPRGGSATAAPKTPKPTVSAEWASSGSTRPCWRRIRAWPSSKTIAAATSWHRIAAWNRSPARTWN